MLDEILADGGGQVACMAGLLLGFAEFGMGSAHQCHVAAAHQVDVHRHVPEALHRLAGQRHRRFTQGQQQARRVITALACR
jgi:hypothetical protein